MGTVTLAVLIAIGLVAATGMWVAIRGILAYRADKAHRAHAGTHGSQTLDSAAVALVSQWAHGRTCELCGGALAESRVTGHHVALLDPAGTTREWVDVAADRLELALATSLPVCWNCHVASTFRRLHPELVTDRTDPPARGRGENTES